MKIKPEIEKQLQNSADISIDEIYAYISNIFMESSRTSRECTIWMSPTSFKYWDTLMRNEIQGTHGFTQ